MSTQLIFSKQQQKLKVSQIMQECKLKQCRYAFYRRDGRYCFLGALYKKLTDRDPIDSFDVKDLCDCVGLSYDARIDIIHKNDSDGWSYTQIADYIEDKYGL